MKIFRYAAQLRTAGVKSLSEQFPSIDSVFMAKQFILLVAVISLCLSGSRAADPASDVIATADKVAVVVAVEPVVRGQWIATALVGRKDWVATDTGFNANEVALAVARSGLKREVQIVDGVGLRIPATSVESGAFPRGDEDLAQKLRLFSEALDVDVVIAIQATEAIDWVTRTSEPFRGGGVYTRGVIGNRRSHAYSALSMRIYSRTARKIVNREHDLRSRQLSEVNWQGSWSEYPVLDRKKILVELDAMTKAGTRALLAKAGLMEPATKEEEELSGLFSDKSVRGESSIPESNEVRIPDGVTREKAREAVIAALKGHGWTVESDTPEKIVATLKERKKEATVEVTFAGKFITLAPALHEIRKDGTRVPVEPNLRSHRKLKEAVWEELLKELF